MTIKQKEKIHTLVAETGILLMFTVFPLFMTHKYFNITISKYGFFAVISVVFAVLCSLTTITKAKRRPNSTDYSFFAFSVLGAITVLLSAYKGSAFTGSEGRYMGYAFYLFAFCLYWFISRHYVPRERDFVILTASLCVVVLIGQLQISGLNPFYLFSGISSADEKRFFSTIGNINVFSVIISTFVPVSIYMLLFKEGNKRYIFILPFIICTAGLFYADSDVGFLGLVTALWVSLLFVLIKGKPIYRFFEVLTLFFISSLIVKLEIITGIIDKSFSGIAKLLLSGNSSLILMLVFLCISIPLRFIKPSPKICKTALRVYLALSIACVLSIIGLFVYVNLINKSASLGKIDVYFKLSSTWGTNRGYIWKRIIKAFNAQPIYKKLFGTGQDTVFLVLKELSLEKHYTAGNTIDNAHNELLQYLLTTGFFGVVMYVSLIVHSIAELKKKQKSNSFYLMILFCLVTYSAQAFVNILQPITAPFLFILIAISSCND